MIRYYLGIDPGKNGGFALLDTEIGKVMVARKFDKKLFLTTVDFLTYQMERTRCCLEKVHAMPKQGSVSMFTFGESYGWLKGVLDHADISYQEVPPQTWKKEFNLNSDKQSSIEVCRQLFPDVNLIPEGHIKEHDGIAEAVLMAEYARRNL